MTDQELEPRGPYAIKEAIVDQVRERLEQPLGPLHRDDPTGARLAKLLKELDTYDERHRAWKAKQSPERPICCEYWVHEASGSFFCHLDRGHPGDHWDAGMRCCWRREPRGAVTYWSPGFQPDRQPEPVESPWADDTALAAMMRKVILEENSHIVIPDGDKDGATKLTGRFALYLTPDELKVILRVKGIL